MSVKTDTPVVELTLDEVRAAAEFRGGKFLGPEENLGQAGAIFEWECENGHRFKASLEYVLCGGGWCQDCGLDFCVQNAGPQNRFYSQLKRN